MGDSGWVDLLAGGSSVLGMETRKHQFEKRVGTSPGGPAVPFPTAFVMKDSGPDLGDGPVPEDEQRSMPPFGSPIRDGQHDQARRTTGGNARNQVDLLHSGTDARAPRQGRWRDQSPLWIRGHLDGPASATIPFLAALREARLNGFAGALAVVPGRCNADRRRRVSDPPPTGLSDASNEGEPAYSLGPHSVSPLRRLAGGRAPCDPRNGNGAA